MKILNRFNSNIIFEFECNTLKECVEEAVKQKANLNEANLWGADLGGANLRGANLWGAVLSEANLRGADLRGADLKGADLSEANLRGANLWGADLKGAVLSEANLRGADLRGADLWGEKLTKNPLYINTGLKWQVWITDKKIKIGCQIHTTIAWSKFSDEQISKMDSEALEFWKKWKEPILAMAKEHQKGE
jgi:hypothetical protein